MRIFVDLSKTPIILMKSQNLKFSNFWPNLLTIENGHLKSSAQMTRGSRKTYSRTPYYIGDHPDEADENDDIHYYFHHIFHSTPPHTPLMVYICARSPIIDARAAAPAQRQHRHNIMEYCTMIHITHPSRALYHMPDPTHPPHNAIYHACVIGTEDPPVTKSKNWR